MDPLTLFKLVNDETSVILKTFYILKLLIKRKHKQIATKYHFNNIQWQNYFFYLSKNSWNKLPNELVLCQNVEQFRHNLKKFDLNKVFVSKICR